MISGLLLVFFPYIYKKVITYPDNAVAEKRISTQSEVLKNIQSDFGPFKIDEKLLSVIEAKQPPMRIIIPDYDIDLPVVEAKVIDGYWETSQTSASHGIGSANPGEEGNIVIFAHAKNNLFGPIRNIKKGTSIYILTKDRWYRYAVNNTKLVGPDNVETIKPTTEETLTLFTCTGFMDSKRLIVAAYPLSP